MSRIGHSGGICSISGGQSLGEGAQVVLLPGGGHCRTPGGWYVCATGRSKRTGCRDGRGLMDSCEVRRCNALVACGRGVFLLCLRRFVAVACADAPRLVVRRRRTIRQPLTAGAMAGNSSAAFCSISSPRGSCACATMAFSPTAVDERDRPKSVQCLPSRPTLITHAAPLMPPPALSASARAAALARCNSSS